MESNLYQRLAFFLVRENHLPQEKAAVLAYAMEILFINILNLMLTMLVGFLLGVLPGTIVCISVATAYRHTAGGAHSKSPWVCALATMMVFPAIAYLGTWLATGADTFCRLIAVVAALLGFYAVYRYAPVDSLQAPIISPERRKRLKRYSYIVIGILISGMLFLELISSLWFYARTVQLCAALTILWVSLNLTDTAAFLWSVLDNQH